MKVHVGNGLSLAFSKNEDQIIVTGNNNNIEITNNLGSISATGNNFQITVKSGNGRIIGIGNKFHIKLGASVPQEVVNFTGNGLKISLLEEQSLPPQNCSGNVNINYFINNNNIFLPERKLVEQSNCRIEEIDESTSNQEALKRYYTEIIEKLAKKNQVESRGIIAGSSGQNSQQNLAMGLTRVGMVKGEQERCLQFGIRGIGTHPSAPSEENSNKTEKSFNYYKGF